MKIYEKYCYHRHQYVDVEVFKVTNQTDYVHLNSIRYGFLKVVITVCYSRIYKVSILMKFATTKLYGGQHSHLWM